MAAKTDDRIDFEREHNAVFQEAINRFKSASAVRGQMWLEFPPSDKIRELRERVTRIEHAYAKLDELKPESPESDMSAWLPFERAIIEDSIDLINYANFLVKQVRRGMRG